MSRNVWGRDASGRRIDVGTTRKYVGRTARTMGSDPAYVAYPAPPHHEISARVFTTWNDARDWLIRLRGE